MEELSKCLIQADNVLNGWTDLQNKKKFRTIIGYMLKDIRNINQQEYNKKSGIDQLKKDVLLKKMQPLGSKL
jgi:hypothetical protein